MSLLHFFLGFSGRINRMQFWLGFGALMLIGFVVTKLLLTPEAMQEAIDTGTLREPTIALTAWDLFTCWLNAAIAIKRLNDRDHDPWIGQLLAASFVVLVLGNHAGYLRDVNAMVPAEKLFFAALMLFFIWALIDCGFLPGTAGPNRFGPDPSNRPLSDERQA